MSLFTRLIGLSRKAPLSRGLARIREMFWSLETFLDGPGFYGKLLP